MEKLDLENMITAPYKYEINPDKDFPKLKKYLEETIIHLKAIWGFT